MTTHTQILNFLIETFNFKSYCEIGTFNRSHNFDLIKVENKICIDPAITASPSWLGTSDSFFDFLNYHKMKTGWDLLWIDGLHEENQVRKDFENCLKYVNKGGFICLHDVNPHSEAITHYPRDSGEWCGTVYRFAMTLHNYSNIDFFTFDCDYGVCVVRKSKKAGWVEPVNSTSWKLFNDNRKELLNLVTVDEGVKLINELVTKT